MSIAVGDAPLNRFLGRTEELAQLGAVLDGRGPSLSLVRGPEGVGTTTLVTRALRGRPHLGYTAVPLTDADHRALLAGRLDLPPDLDWPALLDRLADRIDQRRERTALVLDGFHHLLAVRSRLPALLAAFWMRIRSRSLPLHLLLVGSDPLALGALADEGSPLEDAVTLDLDLEPLPFRVVTGLLAGWPLRDRVVAWTVWGGMPAVVRRLDPTVGLFANLRRTLLDPDAPLLHAGIDVLRRDLQSPARYASILRALALGRREWGELAAAVPDLTSSGQLGPYLARLEALRLIEVRRSLDARERSRSRRYHAPDPFLSFWHRFVLPHLTELEGGAAAEVWTGRIRPALDEHARLFFPDLARAYVRRHAEQLRSPAREAGALWGPGYELDVAATLRSGAVCYGICHWDDRPAGEDALAALEPALRQSRYGFGRETRLRVVFHAGDVADDLLRSAARDEHIRLIGLEELLDGQSPAPMPREPAPAPREAGPLGSPAGITGV